MQQRAGILSLIILLSPAVGCAQYAIVNEFLSLSGTGYISIPYSTAFNAELNRAGRFSIDAWVYPTSLTGYMTIIGNDYTTGYWLGVTPQGKLRFYPRGGVLYESSGAIPVNQWSHVGVSFDAQKRDLRFFINGSSSGGAQPPQGNIGTVTSGDLRIGADRSGAAPAYYWTGRLDEVRIWNESIDFSGAAGLLYRVPHGVYRGRIGRHLVGGWRLNGNASGIGNQFNGTPAGSTAFASQPDPPHYPRIAASFTNFQSPISGGSEDYFEISSSSGNSLTQNYTLECWVKPASSGGSPAWQTLLTKSSAYNGQWTYWLGLNKSNGRARFVPNGDFADGLESSTAVPAGQWTHIAARYQVSGNTRTATVFVNGIPAGSKSYSRNATANQRPLLIGRAELQDLSVNDPMGFSGMIDEVRIWNTARSNDEVLDNHRIELDGPLASLAASYHFDGDVLDASAQGNHGSHYLSGNSDVYFAGPGDLPPLASITVLQPNGGETWFTGATRAVQWSSVGLQNVRVELSRDGGQTWPDLLSASVPAAAGSLSWKVAGPETNRARVRVTTVTPTPVSDESDKEFRIIEPPPDLSVSPAALTFAAPQDGPLPAPQRVRITNIGGGNLQWTASPGTAQWLTIAPLSGAANVDSFEVSVNTTNLLEASYNAAVGMGGNGVNTPLQIPVVYRVTKKQICSIAGKVTDGAKPIEKVSISIVGAVNVGVLTDGNGMYSAPGLPCDQYALVPDNPFYEFQPAVRNYPQLGGAVTDADFLALPKRGRMLFRYHQGWNLVSFPLQPDIGDLKTLLPDIELPAYLFDPSKGYVETSALPPGNPPLWVRCSKTDSVELSGTLLPEVVSPLSASYGGWNLIGAPSGNAALSDAKQTPLGIISSIYEYDPLLGYIMPLGGLLRPGRAYFAKALGDGSVRLYAESDLAAPVPVLLPSLRFPGAERAEKERALPPLPPGR